jgi:hypothetical protein
VANVTQGTTVTWNGVSLGELVSVSVDGISSDAVEVTPRTQASRIKSFSPADVDLGSISCTLRGSAAMSSTNVGLTAALSITGTGISFSFSKAIFEKLGWSASVGELQLYSVSFKVGA